MNQFIAKNQYLNNTLDQYIVNLRETVSTSQIFSDEANKMLSENMCNYFSMENPQAPCKSALKGVAQNGIRAFIYSYTDFLLVNRDYMKGKTFSPSFVISLITRPEKSEIYTLMMGGLGPSAANFIHKIEIELLNFLTARSEKIILAFGMSIWIDVLSLMVLAHLIFRTLNKERRIILNTINLVPLDFILKNSEFKLYLINDNKNFLGLFKKIEKIPHIANFIQKKF